LDVAFHRAHFMTSRQTIKKASDATAERFLFYAAAIRSEKRFVAVFSYLRHNVIRY
jgi:hypothetical protein